MSILIHNARILTLDPHQPSAPTQSNRPLGIIDPGWVLIENETITRVESGSPDAADVAGHIDNKTIIDAQRCVLMPAFVDCHTHLCWAGQRLDEWDAKLHGQTYLQILEQGGGILATVKAVRQASPEQLVEHLLTRLSWMLADGTTTVEIKSGYGLDTKTECKMLDAIVQAGSQWAGTVIPTACIGHAIDPMAKTPAQQRAFIKQTIEETLPAIHKTYPDIAIDAYCEQGAWSLDDCIALFSRASELGHPCRVHADQFSSLGMVPHAAAHGFRSVDHLEATDIDQLTTLAQSDTYGVMLPCSGFHVDGRYANGRAFLDAGGALAIATNINPGSAPCQSMPMAIALAVRGNGLMPEEAIACATSTPARLLGLHDRGDITPGKRADLVLLRHTDERALAFEFGSNPITMTICAGNIVWNTL